MKIYSVRTIWSLLLIVVLLPACTESGGDTKNKSGVDEPKMEIQTAVLSGNLETIKQHIKAGTNINEKEPMGGSTPLISAATFGKIEVAKVLIEAGADLTIKNKDGATALHAAAFFCEVEIVQMLIDAKADKTLKNNFGATPRESVMGPFSDVKPIYAMLGQQLAPLGMQLDMAKIEETRPVIAMMLQ